MTFQVLNTGVYKLLKVNNEKIRERKMVNVLKIQNTKKKESRIC